MGLTCKQYREALRDLESKVTVGQFATHLADCTSCREWTDKDNDFQEIDLSSLELED